MVIKKLQWRRLSTTPGQCVAGASVAITLLALFASVGLGLFPQANRTTAEPSLDVSGNAKRYDPIVLPISGSEVRAGLVRNSRDAQAEYALLLRAGYQHQEKAAYETMDRLRREQPNNAIVLACYFMAFRMAEGGMNSYIYNGMHQSINFTGYEDQDAEALLPKAYTLAPKLWLTYAVDGIDKFYVPGGNQNEALILLKKAEALAPNSPYPHWLLANAYLATPISQQKCKMAAEECKKALAVEKTLSDPAFMLFQIYSLWMPNPTEEVKWKRKFLSITPPNVKLNPDAKKWLDRYPG